MRLHNEKFELLVHRYNTKNLLYELPGISEFTTYDVTNEVRLYPTSQLRDLGVTVSPDLSWSAHICKLALKGRSVAAWIFSVFKTRDRATLLTLYKSLVRSLLEYCCPLWNPSSVGDIKILEGVQRAFTSRITSIKHLNYWERLKELGMMSLQRRRERYCIVTMWKILNNKCPNDVKVNFNAPSRHGITAKIPPLARSSSAANQTKRDHSFSVLGPKLWNCVPSNITVITDFDKFKTDLTDFLITVPDTPPVSGYTSANRNSLLHWFQSGIMLNGGQTTDDQ